MLSLRDSTTLQSCLKPKLNSLPMGRITMDSLESTLLSTITSISKAKTNLNAIKKILKATDSKSEVNSPITRFLNITSSRRHPC